MVSAEKETIRRLCSAVQEGRTSEVDTILQQGMFINADEGGNMVAKSLYRNLLMLAIDSLQVETAKLLINRGIDVNHKTWGVNGKQGAREMAVENGLDEIVELIDTRLPVSKRLFNAVTDGQQSTVENLVKHLDADLNMKIDLYGDKAAGCSAYTLLMVALKNGHVEICNVLIDKGIDLEFEHQEWDRPDANSEPILVESYDARKLADDMGMVGVAKAIDKRKGGVTAVANGHSVPPDTVANGTSKIEVTRHDDTRAAACTCVIT
ncbi:uncharacterized protein [Diadema antillarum]|uniref:uncharacterized protein n=1 Tax=Diadema antillarum TaxID=105358 RepID=UPI003A879B00